MFKEKEQIIEPEKEREKLGVKLTQKDKENLVDLGRKFIEKDPYFAEACFKAAGYSEAAKPVFELADFLRDQEERPIKEKELMLRQKLRLKETGLGFVAANKYDIAKVCFKRAGVSDKEIESLLKLNLLDIEKEKEKIEEELAKTVK